MGGNRARKRDYGEGCSLSSTLLGKVRPNISIESAFLKSRRKKNGTAFRLCRLDTGAEAPRFVCSRYAGLKASASTLLCRNRLRRLLMYGFEAQLAATLLHIHSDRVAVQHLAVEDLHGQRVLHQPLNRPLERTRTVVRVVALGEDQLLRLRRQLERDLAISQQPLQVLKP